MRVALWSPRAGGGWGATLAPLLQRDVEVVVVTEEPPSAPAADVNVYHVDDAPAHGYVYRELLGRPGVVVLEEWGLHRLVHAETAGRGDEIGYRREARRSHGELGSFVTRQVIHGLGGVLPEALLAMNERVLDAGLGFVATSAAVRDRLADRRLRCPVVHLPLEFQTPPPLHRDDDARSRLGISAESLLVIGIQPRGTAAPPAAVAGALEEVRAAEPGVAVRWAGEDAPDIATYIAAADVVVSLEHPPRDGLGSAVPLALAGGKAVLVSAGSGVAREIPDGVVGHVSPGSSEVGETAALVRRLLNDDLLRARMGRLARAFAADRRDPEGSTRTLLGLLRSLEPEREPPAHPPPGEPSLASGALDEMRAAARELGVVELPPGLPSLTTRLFGEGET